MQRFSLALSVCVLLFATPLNAETVRVAVAANFYSTMKALSANFEQSTGHRVELIVGSSGKLAAQILSGAPFDLFVSADGDRPEKLETQGVSIKNSRKTYARGQLVAMIRASKTNEGSGQYERGLSIEQLQAGRIALANPELAPYGRAAKQSLTSLGFVFDRSRLVYGENVSQAFHFFETGNVDVAFVAMSQIIESDTSESLYVPVNKGYYEPIEQQMVLLSEHSAPKELHEYMLSQEAQQLIGLSGYDAVINLISD